ncbi:MAG: hypothetical protein ACKVH0_13295, partial [Alphaproteobacteria bacterium]
MYWPLPKCVSPLAWRDHIQAIPFGADLPSAEVCLWIANQTKFVKDYSHALDRSERRCIALH